jgi:hypothetical protein
MNQGEKKILLEGISIGIDLAEKHVPPKPVIKKPSKTARRGGYKRAKFTELEDQVILNNPNMSCTELRKKLPARKLSSIHSRKLILMKKGLLPEEEYNFQKYEKETKEM